MKRGIIVAMALLGAGPVCAQTQTHCVRSGNVVNCDSINTDPFPSSRSDPDQGVRDFAAGLATLREMRDRRAAQKAELEQRRIDEANRAALQAARRPVFDAMQAHDCVRARDLAVATQDIQFAANVATVCPVPLVLPNFNQ